MNAHHVPRIGLARVGGEHLQAANDACTRCRLDPTRHPQGRRCACSLRATRRAALHAVLWLASAGAVLAAWTLFYGWLTA